MKREELRQMLEEYWYDNQYLKEKAKEINNIESLMQASSGSELFITAKKFEESQMLKIVEKKRYIENLIQNLPQPHKTLMYMKYISFLTFDQIAAKMNYSTKRIYQLHSEGLNKLLLIINEGDTKH